MARGLAVDPRHPKDINEKIQWLMCHKYGRRYSYYADKLAVRKYVTECGFGDLLVPVLGNWKKAEDIDFNSLPDRFVLKCNHDSGSTALIDKTAGFDRDALIALYKRKLSRKFGYVNGEMYYNHIRPRILAEAFLPPQPGEKSVTDYKFWCFDGKPYAVLVCANRRSDGADLKSYDTEWTPLDHACTATAHYNVLKKDVPRPQHLDRMLSAASKLSEGFPVVRVDFFESGGNLYFSELTLTPYGGKIDYYSKEFLLELGAQCKLTK
jgi:hypothetical protein